MGVEPDGGDACPAGPPVWLWPNLLSLDAPLVAVVWQRFLASAFGVAVPGPAAAVLALVVWGVYLADRWLDAADDTDRHRFAGRHPRAFGGAAAGALLAAAVLAVALLPSAYLTAGAGVGVALAAYFAAVHLGRPGLKEAQVGAVFAAGVAVPLIASSAPPADWLPAVVAFAGLCWLNCALIECWEVAGSARGCGFVPLPLRERAARLCEPGEGTSPPDTESVTGWEGLPPHPGRKAGPASPAAKRGGEAKTKAPSRRLEPPALLAALAAAFSPQPVALAVGASLAALLALHLLRHRLSPRALRVLADMALLSPLACPL